MSECLTSSWSMPPHRRRIKRTAGRRSRSPTVVAPLIGSPIARKRRPDRTAAVRKQILRKQSPDFQQRIRYGRSSFANSFSPHVSSPFGSSGSNWSRSELHPRVGSRRLEQGDILKYTIRRITPRLFTPPPLSRPDSSSRALRGGLTQSKACMQQR